SMVLTPILDKVGRSLSQRHKRLEGEGLVPSGIENSSGHVIIAGYGRMGRAIARLLRQHEIRFVALDLDVDRVMKARQDGLPVFFGDASHAGVLRSVGVGGAQAVVVTLGHPRLTERTVFCVHQTAPGVPVFARAQDRIHEALLSQMGAAAVIPETVEASLQIAGLVLRSAGIAEDKVESSLTDYRKNRYGGDKS
ncbi:MAG: potassium transporter KefB, partial [Rhodospirillales bacterium]